MPCRGLSERPAGMPVVLGMSPDCRETFPDNPAPDKKITVRAKGVPSVDFSKSMVRVQHRVAHRQGLIIC
eukprot:gene12940-biopygen4815